MNSVKRRKYNFTYHARKRFKQRFSHLVTNNDVVKSIAAQIEQAQVSRSVHNNTRFITWVHTQHGYEKFEYLVNDEIVFVCQDDKLVTVYPVKSSLFHVEKNRFRK